MIIIIEYNYRGFNNFCTTIFTKYIYFILFICYNYINAENDDKSEIAEVMKMMSTKDYVNPKYKNIKKAKEEKLMPVEVREAIEDLKAESMAKGMQEGKIKTIIELLNQGLISEEVALSSLKLSKAELDQKIKELNS